MKEKAQGRECVARLRRIVLLACLMPALAWGQQPERRQPQGPQAGERPPAPDGEFVYHARLHDTLIGLSRRLLIEPRRWPQLQTRNNIKDPRHIPLDYPIRIPYGWLRLVAETATVLAVNGEVQEGGRAITASEALAEGVQIETGADGSATLLLADGSVLTLQKSSVLSLAEMRRVNGVDAAHATRFKLQSGRLQTRVKPHGDVGRFEIVTPVAVSAVRGTEFRDAFEPEEQNATTETLEGLVSVAGAAASVPVPADFGTRVAHDAPPMPPVRLLAAPDLSAIANTNGTSRLQLQWPAVQGAEQYRVQLAPDAQFQSFVADTKLEVPQADLQSPADGVYWVRVRAIDRFGLEGHDAVLTFTQQLLPPPPPPVSPVPEPPTFANRRIQFKWEPREGMRYHVQIARDSRFGSPLLDETVASPDLSTHRFRPGTYFARVAVITNDGTQAPFGQAREFRVPIPLWLKIFLPLLTLAAIVR